MCSKNRYVTGRPAEQYKEDDTVTEHSGSWCTYFSSSLVVTSPMRRTVSIPPDTRPNIE